MVVTRLFTSVKRIRIKKKDLSFKIIDCTDSELSHVKNKIQEVLCGLNKEHFKKTIRLYFLTSAIRNLIQILSAPQQNKVHLVENITSTLLKFCNFIF